MKSAIYLALSEATGLKIKRGQDKQEFFTELVKAVADLKDPEWDALTVEQQDWYNAAASAKNKKATIPDFPDLKEEKEEKEEAPARRRRSADDEDKKADEPMLKVGDEVTILTKKGTSRLGVIVEHDEKIIAIKDDQGDEYEYKIENLESITAKHGAAKDEDEGKPRRRRAAEDDDGPAIPELKKGSAVIAVTKRGTKIEGTIVEIDDEKVVIDNGKEELEYDRDRLESLSPVGGKSAKAEEPEEGRRSTRGSSAKAEEPAGETKGKRANNGEVSIGQRIRELIAEDLDISLEAVIKQLNKEKLEFKDNTVSLNFKEANKFLEILRAAKRLK